MSLGEKNRETLENPAFSHCSAVDYVLLYVPASSAAEGESLRGFVEYLRGGSSRFNYGSEFLSC